MSASESELPARRLPAGPILILWIILSLLLQAAMWVSGARSSELTEAVDFGAGKVETRSIGEAGDDVIRKAIAIQQDSRSFWTVLALFGDFVVEPLGLAVRAGTVAVLFAGISLLRGRTGSLAEGLTSCALAQGFWVLGLAVRTGLAIGLRRSEIETSPTLFLSPGTHSGIVWAGLHQLDIFAILGWLVMLRCGIFRMRIGFFSATLICLFLFVFEALWRLQFSIIIEAGMRLTLLPET